MRDPLIEELYGDLPVRWERLGLVPDPRRGMAWARPDGALVVDLEVVGAGRVRLTVRAPTASGLMIMPRRLALTLGGGLAIGDPEFDDAVFVASEDPTVCGLLDADTRAAVRSLIDAGGFVTGGAVVVPDDLVRSLRGRLEAFVGSAQAVAQRLAAGADARLAGVLELVRNDALVTVRRAVYGRFADHAGVRALAQARARDTTFVDPWGALDGHAARIEALVASGEPRAVVEVLSALAAELVDAAATAIERQLDAGRLTPEIALSYVAHLDNHPAMHDEARVRLFEALGRTRNPALSEWLAAASAHHDPRVFEAAFVGFLRTAGRRTGLARLLSPASRDRAVRAAPDLMLADVTLAGPILGELYRFVESPAQGLRARYAEAFVAIGHPSGGLSLAGDGQEGGLTLADRAPSSS